MAQRRQKRQRRAQKLQDSLVVHLEHSRPGTNVKAFLEALQQWLGEHMDKFSPDERCADQLELLATMKLDDLPTMYAELDPIHTLRRFREEPPDFIAEVGMRIGRVFWEGITVLSDRECPDCESLMRVLEEENTGRLGYECNVCTRAELEDGTSIQGPGRWGPATTEALRRRGLLLRSV